MQFKKINKNLIWTDEGFGNTVAINTGGKVFVIDSTTDWKLAKEWRETVEKHFKEPVSGLILTHHHADHTFGNQVFSDLPIIASYNIRNIMKENKKHHWILEDMIEWEDEGYGIKDLQITLPNICFKDKITLHGERSVDVIQVDGHTLGSTYIWEEENRTLLAGDLIFNRQFPYGGDETSDLLKWNGVLDDLINLKPEIVISGHGPPATANDLMEIKDFLSATIDFIRKRISEGISVQDIPEDPDFPDYHSKNHLERRKATLEKWIEDFTKKKSIKS